MTTTYPDSRPEGAERSPDPWLTLIWAKQRQTALQGLSTLKALLARLAGFAGDAATTLVGVLATRTGYQAIVELTGRITRGAASLIGGLLRALARPVGWAWNALTGLLRRLSPTIAGHVDDAAAKVVGTVRAVGGTIAGVLTATVGLLGGLARTSTVQEITTGTAKVAGVALIANSVTGGMLVTAAGNVSPVAGAMLGWLLSPLGAITTIAVAFLTSLGLTLMGTKTVTEEPLARPPMPASIAA